MPDLPTGDAVRAFTRRHRRPLAALSAGVAVLIALSAMVQPPPAPVAGPGTLPIGDGQVAISIPLGISSEHVQPGSRVDIVSVPGNGAPARVVARGSSVLDVAASTMLASSSTTTVLLSVSEADALALADAASSGPLTALLQPNTR